MGITYERCEKAWDRRRKGSNWKAVERDCKLTRDGDDFVVKYHGWYAGRGTGVSKTEGLPLLRINRDDIVTVLSSGEVQHWKQQTTLPNRFSSMLGMNVFRTAALRNREHITRIVPEKHNWGDHKPFFAGLQINMKTKQLVNPKEDVSIVVDKTAVKTVSDKTRTLRMLVRGMARMGAFKDLTEHRRSWQTTPSPKFENINLDEPTGDDARAIVIAGLHSVHMPPLSYYNTAGQWVQRSTEEQTKMLLDSAVSKGLELFRRYLYDTTEGSYVKVPAKQRNT